MTTSPLVLDPNTQVIVTGSLAFDQIMVFPGNFKDHVLPDKLHIINISFLVHEMRQQRGGCAGNIAYTMALLGHNPKVVAAAGEDFSAYDAWLKKHGVDTSGVRIFEDQRTASCFITTDQADNQITGFYGGAMNSAGELSLAEAADPDRPNFAIIAPDAPDAMLRHCREAREHKIPFLFDPSFQVTAMDGEQLLEASEGAAALAVNDYEFAVFQEKTGKKDDAIFDLVDLAIVTLGKEGSRLLLKGQDEILVPAAEISGLVDPTGAGDAFRGGFVSGLLEGRGLDEAGRIASLAAAHAVELNGTQNHAYTREEFEARYEKNFGALGA